MSELGLDQVWGTGATVRFTSLVFPFNIRTRKITMFKIITILTFVVCGLKLSLSREGK